MRSKVFAICTTVAVASIVAYVTITYARGSNPENPQDWIAFILTGLVIATVATALIGSLVTIRGKNNSAERR